MNEEGEKSMTCKRQNHKAIRFAVSSALAAVLVTGCAGSSHVASAGKYSSQAQASKSQQKLDRSVEKAERVVERNPRDVSARIALADAYLQAGRFDSAATTYNDALALGDTSARTSLSLALADIGSGHDREAVAILDDVGDSLPASDLGLALALAGETSRGVAILAEALRDGEDTPKLRQNLAYAYALDGRWREARLMAAQDVPADQLDARISNWAMQGKPEDFQKRVAGLLRAPVRSDAGQPASIALNDAPSAVWPETAAVAPAV
ncbi:MAG: tetratricopeptide repeat protein [Novosphingobium sp.]